MDYAFLSKEGRGAQVVMEKAKGSRGSTCAGDKSDVFTRRMRPLIDSCLQLRVQSFVLSGHVIIARNALPLTLKK